MKIKGILNSEIACVLAGLGHTDYIVIADCGLPVPENVKKIDISLKQGFPSLLETLNVVMDDMEIEKVIIASEITERNTALEQKLLEQLGNINVEYVKHEDFKVLTKNAKAIIRTGEATPYANIILFSGVTF